MILSRVILFVVMCNISGFSIESSMRSTGNKTSEETAQNSISASQELKDAIQKFNDLKNKVTMAQSPRKAVQEYAWDIQLATETVKQAKQNFKDELHRLPIVLYPKNTYSLIKQADDILGELPILYEYKHTHSYK